MGTGKGRESEPAGTLEISRGEENLLHWLVQCCLSDRLLAKSGLHPETERQYLADVRTLDAKLKALW